MQAHYDPLGLRQPRIALGFWKKGPVDYEKIRNSITASFSVDVAKTSGRVVHSFELPFADVGYGEGRGLYLVGDFEQSKVRFEKNVDYILKVKYAPGPIPPPAQELFFTIKDCAEY